MARMFGTDGVRGIANKELTCELAFKLGQSAAVVLTRKTAHRPKILIGKDSRISSDMLEAAVAAGVCSVGGDAYSLSLVPTPAVAYLVKKYNADAGVMISASHNPFEHNGIKLFSGDGFKLPDVTEDEIENLIVSGECQKYEKQGGNIGRAYLAASAAQDYVDHVVECAGADLRGLKVSADCANGSASATFGLLAEKLGIEADMISFEPDGVNINEKCGSTHLENLRERVVKNCSDFGVAFDGDADRMLAVDENGEVVDGDKLMAIFAQELLAKGALRNQTLVCTTMSNMGLYETAESVGFKLRATDVGDRYVLEEMIRGDYALGGENSGHIIFRDFATTGDGQMAAVMLFGIVKKSGKKLSELADIVRKYPQVMINVQTTPEIKAAYKTSPAVTAAISAAERELGERGRIIVRPSGTEPLVRVMLEGKDFDQIQRLGQAVADAIKKVEA